MKRIVLTTALALCMSGLGAAHAEAPRQASFKPEFGKDLVVDLSAGLGSAAKRAGATTDTWRWMGVANIDSNDTPPQSLGSTDATAKRAGAMDESRDTKDSQRWLAVNLSTGFEYRVEMPKAFAHQIHRYAELTGGNMGDARSFEPATRIEDRLEEKAWSNGVDTRTRRFDNTAYPFRAMGQMGGGERSGCSGTLIAHNIVLTAAHCIYSLDNASFYSLAATRFRPGREGECNDASCEPYGEHNAIWYFTPEEFRENANPWPYDYGIMVLGTSPGDQTGWLGYYALTDAAMEDYCADSGNTDGRCFNRGYPACGLSGAPGSGTVTTSDDCVQGWAYQDTNNCEVGGFGSQVNDGWNSRVRVNCDMSGGHSGSALFTDVWAGNKKVVFGVASTQDSNVEYPNVFRRITPYTLDAISYFKAAYP